MFTIKAKHIRTGKVDVVEDNITRKEAAELVREYRFAFGIAYQVWLEPEKDGEGNSD